MILEYTITDKMISSVVSISEKIGRIREIRSFHKHIDFDMMCNMKNIQGVLRDKCISYPDRIITELMESKSSVKIFSEDKRIVNEEIDRYRRVRARKSYHPSNFKESFRKAGSQKLESQPQIPKEVIAKLTATDKFFLYRVAEFCDACNTITHHEDWIELWLTAIFHEKYNMLLYFPYKDILAFESSIMKNGKKIIDKLNYEARIEMKSYVLIEFYLSVINSTLDQSLKMHYNLSNPTSDRVKMLQGQIREPFSRKDYMYFHSKISTATASLDLKKAVEKGILVIDGDKRNARYWYKDDM